MRSTFFGIETMRRAILTQRRVMDTIGHNVANASTPGYTRQEVILEPTRAFPYPGVNRLYGAGQIGTGVIAEEVRRIRDEFVDGQVRMGTMDSAPYQVEQSTLRQIENAFLEPSTNEGLNDALTKFFNAWQDLSLNPDNTASRNYVISMGRNLTDVIRHIDQTLRDIRVDLNGQILKDVDQVNQILQEIATLTPEIAKVFTHGDSPNDLLDKRDVLLDELSQYLDFDVIDSEYQGGIAISVGGREILRNDHVFELTNELAWDHPSQNTQTPYMSDVSQSDYYMLSQFSRGELMGLVNSRDSILPEIQQKFQDLVGTLVDSINNVHSQGFGIQQEQYDPIGSGITTALSHNSNYATINSKETELFTVGEKIMITDPNDSSNSIIAEITRISVEEDPANPGTYQGRLYFDNTGALIKTEEATSGSPTGKGYTIAAGAEINKILVDKYNFFETPEQLDEHVVGDTNPEYFSQMTSTITLPEQLSLDSTIKDLENRLGIDITDNVNGERLFLDNGAYTARITENMTIEQVMNFITRDNVGVNDANPLGLEFDEINRTFVLTGQTRESLDQLGGENGSGLNLFRILGFEGYGITGLSLPTGTELSTRISDIGISKGWIQIDNAKIQIDDTSISLQSLLDKINDTLKATAGAGSENTSIFFDASSGRLRIVSDHMFSINTPVPDPSSGQYPDPTLVTTSNLLTLAGLQRTEGQATYAKTQELASITTSDIAARLKINDDLIGTEDNINRIASAMNYAGIPGDNSAALDIAELKNTYLMGDASTGNTATPTLTMDGYYNDMISDLGVRSKQAQMNLESADSFLEYYLNRQEEISGVSIDEEMTKLIEAQHAFQAASRMINTIDSMLDRIINGTGLVGR